MRRMRGSLSRCASRSPQASTGKGARCSVACCPRDRTLFQETSIALVPQCGGCARRDGVALLASNPRHALGARKYRKNELSLLRTVGLAPGGLSIVVVCLCLERRHVLSRRSDLWPTGAGRLLIARTCDPPGPGLAVAVEETGSASLSGACPVQDTATIQVTLPLFPTLFARGTHTQIVPSDPALSLHGVLSISRGTWQLS